VHNVKNVLFKELHHHSVYKTSFVPPSLYALVNFETVVCSIKKLPYYQGGRCFLRVEGASLPLFGQCILCV
jgi:hypothetical protein